MFRRLSLAFLHLSHSLSPQALSQSISPPQSVSSTNVSKALMRLGLPTPQCLDKLREAETRWLWQRVMQGIPAYSFSVTNPDVCLRGFKGWIRKSRKSKQMMDSAWENQNTGNEFSLSDFFSKGSSLMQFYSLNIKRALCDPTTHF